MHQRTERSTAVRPPAPRQAAVPGHRKPHPLVTAAVAACLAVGIAAAVTLPILLDHRTETTAQSLRGEVQSVASAQVAYRSAHGTFTTQLADLGVTASRHDVAIVRADGVSFCVGAYDPRSRAAVFFSSGAGYDSRACR